MRYPQPRAGHDAAGRTRPHILALSIALACMSTCLHAAPIEHDIAGLKMSWDNTLKYSNAFRLKSQDPALLSNPNADDGDRNFNKGLISNRVDILSEFDLQYADVGARVSAAAWYDQVYNRSNDNPGFAGAAYPNAMAGAHNRFNQRTRELHGRKGELLDAFLFTRFSLGDARGLLRVGQHGLVWGESLFYGANGIAGAMAPVDVTKLVSVPGTQFKEAIRPVPQVSGQLQLTSNLALGGFYQFRYRANRLPAVGSYFSQIDTNVDGAESMLLGPMGVAMRAPDLLPKRSGQGGLQLRYRNGDTDFGVYALRFHSKSPQLVTNLVNITPMAAPTLVPGSFYVTYHEGITAFGASASRTFGSANVALEASVRNDQDLASAGHAVDLSRAFGMPATNNTSNPAYAVGRTAHINLSTLWSLDPTALFQEANVAAELAWNRVLSCKTNCAVHDLTTGQGVIDNRATRDALALRVQFEPRYRQALPGLDLGVPIGLGYVPKGGRSMALGSGTFPASGGGDISVGINGSYLDAWQLSVGYTHYFGAAATFLDANNSFSYGQSLKDRDFIAFSVRRTF